MYKYPWTYRFHNLIAHPLLILWPSVGVKLHRVFDFENGSQTAIYLSCKNCGHNIYEHMLEYIPLNENYGVHYGSYKRRLKCGVHGCTCPVYDAPLNTWDVRLSRLWWRDQ